jgi:hypothetical protein
LHPHAKCLPCREAHLGDAAVFSLLPRSHQVFGNGSKGPNRFPFLNLGTGLPVAGAVDDLVSVDIPTGDGLVTSGWKAPRYLNATLKNLNLPDGTQWVAVFRVVASTGVEGLAYSFPSLVVDATPPLLPTPHYPRPLFAGVGHPGLQFGSMTPAGVFVSLMTPFDYESGVLQTEVGVWFGVGVGARSWLPVRSHSLFTLVRLTRLAVLSCRAHLYFCSGRCPWLCTTQLVWAM